VPDATDDVGTLRARVESLDAQVAQLQDRMRVLEAGSAPVRIDPPPVPPPSDRAKLERRLGLTAVNRIGALTLAIGIIFFFRYAVDNEWIGAAGRVVAGVTSGLLLIGAAERLSRREQRTFSQGLAGCGVATLYISLYAAFAYYKLIGETAAFTALIAVCGFSVAVSFRYLNPAIAALGFLGGILTPMLLHPGSPAAWPDALYLFLLDVTCVIIAVRRRWTALIPSVGAAAVFAGWFLFDSHHPGRFVVLALALASLHAWGAARSSGGSGIRDVLYLTANGCFIVAILRELGIWIWRNIPLENRGNTLSEMDSLLLGLYGIVTLTYGIARASPVNRSLALFLLGLTITKLYLWDVWFLERFYRTTAFVGLGVLLLAASWIYSRSRRPVN
jgi:uncharacterized membrane protein